MATERVMGVTRGECQPVAPPAPHHPLRRLEKFVSKDRQLRVTPARRPPETLTLPWALLFGGTTLLLSPKNLCPPPRPRLPARTGTPPFSWTSPLNSPLPPKCFPSPSWTLPCGAQPARMHPFFKWKEDPAILPACTSPPLHSLFQQNVLKTSVGRGQPLPLS